MHIIHLKICYSGELINKIQQLSCINKAQHRAYSWRQYVES